jgi:hypothetical protein
VERGKRPTTPSVASKPQLTMVAEKVIVSDYRYFLSRENAQKMRIIWGKCGFLTVSNSNLNIIYSAFRI